MKTKKIIAFFSLFFLSIFSLIYINDRKENRKDYHFVITKVIEEAKGNLTVSNADNEFGFANFDSYKKDIQKEDSLVKKAFSKKVYIYRRDKKTDKYFLTLVINESAIFPIEWQ
ncbi:hypothetical protein C8C83_4792 [Flavobacterium sp. 90]|uniref:hypothetical protein n=1 Tax=unclassified Flavobacterium TaxID=196869 RepID=UPI000EB33CD6|nr:MULTISPECIES: hypothetical protein [unclassified Flavobacterium]RKR05444.1 hypothetical protein C8C82_5134 [Flavobacterium sp. 81]TCK56759.1 hypothetical protein C8C83_4792 [Flavobacterium sp. 90]